MSIIKNFRNPWEDDNWVLQTDVLDTSVLDDNVLSDLSQSPIYFNVKEVSKVRSLTREDYKETEVRGSLSFLGKKLKARDKILDEIIGLGWDKNNPEISTAISNLRNRWSSTRSLTKKGSFIIYKSKLKVAELKQKDIDDMAKLSSSRYNSTKEVINEFTTALDDYIEVYDVWLEEGEEFKRFDTIYNDNVTKRILSKIPYIKILPAEIKAINCKESGDFTNTSIKGISSSKLGIKTYIENKMGAKGIGQIRDIALVPAKEWLSQKGIDISKEVSPTPSDFRDSPKLSIYLTAAYFGYLIEKELIRQLPKPIPQGIELKKFMLAAYNWGPTNLLKMLRRNVSKGQKYSWDDVASKSPNETQKYIDGIVERLTNG